MDWFVTNWFSILIFIAFIAMHFVMHPGHGGHGGSGHQRSKTKTDLENEESKGQDADQSSSGHRH